MTSSCSAIRSAEEDRVSSCSFADRIARLSVDFFRRNCPPDLLQSYKQTVVSTIILSQQISTTNPVSVELTVISMGVGTKVLPYALVCEDDNIGLRVRDCHAEVLAHRGMLRFLTDQILLAKSLITDKESIFQTTTDGKLTLRAGFAFHLYTSSQPCGNASIKRWAKSQQHKYRAALSEHEYPYEPHQSMQITVETRRAGQVALLVKKNRILTSPSNEDLTKPGSIDGNSNYSSTKEVLVDPALAAPHLPAGTALPTAHIGNVMTCSDKIALWNALGLQGSLLSGILGAPLYLSSIIVGRKFSRVHCERALCCRLQEFCHPSGPINTSSSRSSSNKRQRKTLTAAVNSSDVSDGLSSSSAAEGQKATLQGLQYYTHHPAMLGTAVKLDEGSILTAVVAVSTTAVSAVSHPNPVVDSASSSAALPTPETAVVGARFDEPRCLCFYLHSDSAHTESSQQGTSSSTSFTDAVLSGRYQAEVLDGRTGLLYIGTGDSAGPAAAAPKRLGTERDSGDKQQLVAEIDLSQVSSISSYQLRQAFHRLLTTGTSTATLLPHLPHTAPDTHYTTLAADLQALEYRAYKQAVAAPSYIAAKTHIKAKPTLLGDWIDKKTALYH